MYLTDGIPGRLHTDDAFLLSHVMGEPVAASQFASLARDETDALKRMQVVTEEALGGRAKLSPFHDQTKLVNWLMRTRDSRLVVEFHSISGPQHLLLRRDGQQQWRILTPGQGWQPLHAGQNLPTNIGNKLWKDSARDKRTPIRILGSTGPHDTSPDSVGRRLRATYHTMCSRTPEVPASPGAKAVRNELIARIVRDERGFETNDSALRRLRSETQRIDYKTPPHTTLQNLADDLEPKTFDELHRTGELDGVMQTHLRKKFNEDMRKVNLSMPSMRTLSRLLESNFVYRSQGTKPLGKQVTLSTQQYVVSKETKVATAAFTKKITNVLSQGNKALGEIVRTIRALAHHRQKVEGHTTPLEDLDSDEFDEAARRFLDHKYAGERTKPLHQQSENFVVVAHALAHIHNAAFEDAPIPRMQADDRAAHGINRRLYRYRSRQSMPPPQGQ